MSDAPAQQDYRSTVFLPKTDFPMKAGLPLKEPLILAKWQEGDLYGRLRKARAGREKFILHDGPPYANGDIHIGHALNHILKDMVVRTQTLLGKDAPYVPGWDCHGLPIEWKVEEQYRKKKLDKDQVPLPEFRAECRAYAQHWVDTQREQLKRLGIGGDWDHPYLTMDFDAEATIVAELMKFAESGQLYRGAKPVMWSPVEKTALAEAEIEYEDIVSTQVDVAFEILESPIPELVGAHAVVWTTTPWTIPVNQAIAYGPEVEYVLIEAVVGDGAALSPWRGKRFLIAEALVDEFEKRLPFGIVRLSPIDQGQAPTGPNDFVRRPCIIKNSEVVDSPRFKGSSLAGTIARHPMAKTLFPGEGRGPGQREPLLGSGLDPGLRRGTDFYAKPRPFLPGDFVTTDTGTGLVHMAPDHGEDDFTLCKSVGIDPVFAVEADGKYREDWAWLGGQGTVINNKFNAPDGPICSDLREAGALLAASADYAHSYPHSWRSKAKVIYRCTPQWFIAMDRPLSGDHCKGFAERRWENEGGALLPSPSPLVGEGGASAPGEGRAASAAQENPSAADAAGPHPNPSPQGGGATLRQLALNAIAATRFVPEKGRNRIGSMVAERPDWVISRQRAWGVPIALFVERKSGKPLVDHAVNERIIAAVREAGVDAWSDDNEARFLGEGRDPADYERVTDILDVWFDSGCTHVFTLESGRWPDQRWPADLYLEGSDQHRGWFQSSLLESCGTRGRAPYNTVLTHGFTMDSKGMKMSKSLGNTINPLDLMRDYGADILRLWALSVDFTEDHRIGKEILAGVADQYRKLRNTFRYLLGALEGFEESERITDLAAMPELERYMLHLTAEMDAKLRQAVEDFDYNNYVRLLSDFANNDLSAFFFDIRKDSLYCDAPSDPKRRAYRSVLDTLFHAMVRWAAPVLVFTTEEVWGTRYPDADSVHLLEWPQIGRPSEDDGKGTVPRTVTQPIMGLGRHEMDPSLRWDDGEKERWEKLRELRPAVTEAIEPLRRDKVVGSSLQAEIRLPEANLSPDLAELFITAQVTKGDTLTVTKTSFEKCGRCWRHLPEVTHDGALCGRCEAVVHG